MRQSLEAEDVYYRAKLPGHTEYTYGYLIPLGFDAFALCEEMLGNQISLSDLQSGTATVTLNNIHLVRGADVQKRYTPINRESFPIYQGDILFISGIPDVTKDRYFIVAYDGVCWDAVELSESGDRTGFCANIDSLINCGAMVVSSASDQEFRSAIRSTWKAVNKN